MRSVLRVVVDTNVLVSGLISPIGAAREVVNDLIAGRFEPVLTPDLAFELQSVMARPKFSSRVVDQLRLTAILSKVGPEIRMVEPVMLVRDPGDAIVVVAAIDALADIIVTGDRDLLNDSDVVDRLWTRSIEVMTPAEFVNRLNAEPPAAR